MNIEIKPVDLGSIWQTTLKFRFLVIGAINTGIGYAAFLALFLLLGSLISYLAIAVLSHLVSACISFYLQRRIVFRSSAPWLGEFLRYNLSLVGVLVSGLGGLYVLVSLVGLHPLAAQGVVIGFSVVISYLVHRHYSFQAASVREN